MLTNLKKHKIVALIFVFILALITLPSLVSAACVNGKSDQASYVEICPPVSGGPSTLPELIANVTQYISGLAGSLALLALIYGGIRYITAAGNEKEAEHAKEILKYAISGIVIIILSYTIIVTVNNIFFQ